MTAQRTLRFYDGRGSRSEEDRGARFHVTLLGAFEFSDDRVPVMLSESSERLLAFLALQGFPVKRELVAGSIWPDATECRASSSLRSAIARLGAAREAVEASSRYLSLASDVVVDFRASASLAYRLLDSVSPRAGAGPWPGTLLGLSADLLPGWYDEWALQEAEQWRHLRVHALEALAGQLSAEGRLGEAAACAAAAIRADSLRESARAALVRIQIAEGNHSAAVRETQTYARLLLAETGAQPSQQLLDLVRPREAAHGPVARTLVGGSAR